MAHLIAVKRGISVAALVAASLTAPVHAQQPMPGFTPVNAAAERTREAEAIARPDAARARTMSRELSRETHVAGRPKCAHAITCWRR